MFLEKIVLQGFKSFVKKTTFEFKKPLVAIIGPNGAGKSNLADAFRWVMGEQSLKLLRCKKAEDIIFNGSKKMPRAGCAQAELYLNNEGRRLNMDYQEIVLTRRLFRDSESEYFINKNIVRLQDILLMLAKANFGQKSYAVIGQGEITDILNANPAERKAFFDEATGVKEFQIKRDLAINKLIRTEENLKQAETILGEIEPRLYSLRRQMKRLEQRKKIEGELFNKQRQYYGSLWRELSDNLKITRQKLDEEKNKEEAIERESQEIEEKIKQSSLLASRDHLYQNLQQQYQEFLEKKNALLKEQVILRGELELAEERLGQTKLVLLQRNLEEINKEIEKITADENTLWLEIKQQENILQEKLKIQERTTTEFSHLEYHLLKTKEELERYINPLNPQELRERLKKIFLWQEEFLKKLLKTDSLIQFKEVQKEAQQITQALAQLLDELYAEKESEVITLKTEINLARKKLQACVENKEAILKEINELRIALQTNKEKAKILAGTKKEREKQRTRVSEEIKKIEEDLQGKGEKEKLLEYQKKNQIIEEKLKELEKSLKLIQEKIQVFNEEEEGKKKELLQLEEVLRLKQGELIRLNSVKNYLQVEIAKLETRKDDLGNEIKRAIAVEKIQEIYHWIGELKNKEKLQNEIENLKDQLALVGAIDPETVQEYEETSSRVEFLRSQIHDLKKAIASLEKLIDSLDATIKKEFSEKFRLISENFNKYFRIIFGGGYAKLTVLTEKEPEEMIAEKTLYQSLGLRKKKQKVILGIEIDASPPGKKIHSIYALSGGEKSMTALSLICAIIAISRPPFVILDEVEAALDEINSEKFVTILKRLSGKTQFVIITHNRATMQAAPVLYGVTMAPDGASHVLSLELKEAEKLTEK